MVSVLGITLLVPLGFVVALAQSHSVPGCPAARVNGCSVPYGLPFAYKKLFVNACNKHDICYRCGAMHGWSRTRCDLAFNKDMYRVCESPNRSDKRFLSTVWNWVKGVTSSEVKRCKSFGDLYYKVVELFGESHYSRTSSTWCNLMCAHKHGNPYTPLSVK